MFKISSQEEFGLRFLLHLAKEPGKEISLAEIADKEGVSLTYVRKIFGVLREHGLVQASKGPQAGYSLKLAPEDLSLKQIFFALKTVNPEFSCDHFSGNLETCANHDNCSVRPLIGLIRAKLDDLLNNIKLSELIDEERMVRDRLARKEAPLTPVAIS